MPDNEPKVDPVVEEPKKKAPVPKLTLEQIASRQQAHAIKVAKFLAGGEF